MKRINQIIREVKGYFKEEYTEEEAIEHYDNLSIALAIGSVFLLLFII